VTGARPSEMQRLRAEFPSIDRDQRLKSMQFAVGCLVRAELKDDPVASANNAALAQSIFEREGYPEKPGWIAREKARQMPKHLAYRAELNRFRKSDDPVGDFKAQLRSMHFCAIRDQYEHEDVAYALIMGNFEHEQIAQSTTLSETP
jgi:hypothetical protein